MRDLWNGLEAWFASNTDGDLALRRGASEDEIVALENAFGRPLPSDLRESFALHDGQDMPSVRWFDGERHLHPLASILAQWQADAGEAEAPPDDFTEDQRGRNVMTHAGRLPLIGTNYWDGDNLYADFIPGPAGREGQLLYRFDIELIVVADSWRAFLEEYLRKLQAGELVYHKGVDLYPEAKGGIAAPGAPGDVFASFRLVEQ